MLLNSIVTSYGLNIFFRTRGNYVHEDQAEKFTYTFSLVFFQCIINALFAKACKYFNASILSPVTLEFYYLMNAFEITVLMTIMKQGADDTKQSYYASCSFSYLSAMLTSNWALRHVTYPMQVCYFTESTLLEFAPIIQKLLFLPYSLQI